MMKIEKSPITGDWLCWIPGTGQAYMEKKKKNAEKFAKKVNEALANGELVIINGHVRRAAK